MSQAKPIVTTARVEAYVASAFRLLAWLLTLILRIGATGRGARLRLWLARAERAVEGILFLKAVALYGPPPRQRRRPRFAASGFRRVQARRLRLFFRRANVRARKAGALERVIALINALAQPQRAVAYFFKQICKGLHLGRITPVAPPAHTLARDALTAAEQALPDTS